MFALKDYITSEDIKNLRKNLGLTQKEFASLVGTSKPVSYEKAASGKTYICVTAGASSGWHCIDNHVYLYNTYGK